MIHWKPAKFYESTEELRNPGIGWYQLHSFRVTDSFDREEERWSVSSSQSLVLVHIHLGEQKNEDLSREELLNIEQILTFFAEEKKDILLRLVYDREGKGIENEPLTFSQVERHIEQLGTVLEQFRAQIYVFQGILVGSWGEMHTSKFLSVEKVKRLEMLLQKYLADNVYRAVRRPVDVRNLCCKSEWEEGKDAHLTCFDDAIFGSDTHMGTFSESDSKEWLQPWCRERELDFLRQLGERAPVGGEVVCPPKEPETIEKMVEELRQMHVSYLNCHHDGKLLEKWKQCRWEKKGIWHGMSGYDYIGRHLGYRFCVRACRVRQEKERAMLTVKIENVGFSPVYEELEVFLVWRTEEGNQGEMVLPWKPSEWRSGETVVETAEIEDRIVSKTCCAWYLGLRRKRDGLPVFFANESDSEGLVYLGTIK